VARRYENLQTFRLADALVIDLYQCTQALPLAERFGLQTQLRRAAVSVVANIIEGSARPTAREYARFLHIAIGSASETSYLLTLAGRLSLLPEANCRDLSERYRHVVRALESQINALRRLEATTSRSKPAGEASAWSP